MTGLPTPWEKAEVKYQDFQLDAFENTEDGEFLVLERMAEKAGRDAPTYQTVIVGELDDPYVDEVLITKATEEQARTAAHNYITRKSNP